MNSYDNNSGERNEAPLNQVPEQPAAQGSQQAAQPAQPVFHQAPGQAPQQAQMPPIYGPGNMPGGGNIPPRGHSPYENSPYASSPYMNQPPQQDAWGNPVSGGSKPPKPPRPHKTSKANPWGKRILAGALTLVLVAAGCGITALGVNSHWQKVNERNQAELQQQVQDLQKQIRESAQAASGGSVAPGEALTPAQVYAQNVSSVVAISSTMAPNALGQVGASSGSGFILSADGYVVTNHHVINGATKVSVITGDNTEYPAKVVGKDPANDVAVLKIDAHDLPAVTIGSSNDLLIGDMVVAIGNPLGELTATQTVGYVCGKDRTVATGGAAINMLQTDAAINPGNSGGPLFNMKGEVIGITTAKYSGTTGSGASIEGIGFAVPIDDVLGIIHDLVEFGYVTGGYLGISVRDVDPQIASVYSIPMGAYVVEVVPGFCAEKAGLQPKDIIVQVEDSVIRNSNDLIRVLRKYDAGDEISVTVSRAGAEKTLSMELDEKPQQGTTPTSDSELPPEAQQQLPREGDFDEWFEYFDKFFNDFFND